MGSTATTAFFLFLIILVVGAGAFMFALTAVRIARVRYEQQVAARRARSWGGKHHERVRSKYFDKERRARAARERGRSTFRPAGSGSDSASPEPISDVELSHRKTLGLVGVELTPYVVREAYRRRVREYHPDRVAGLGIKLRILAEEETKRINDAYRYLNRSLEPVPEV